MFTSEALRLLSDLTLSLSLFSLCFCLYVVTTSRRDFRRTLEAVVLCAVAFLAVYTALHIGAFSLAEPAFWKFSLLGAVLAYLTFNLLTFPGKRQS